MELKKKILIAVVALAVIIVLIVISKRVRGDEKPQSSFSHVEKGEFIVTVETSGELEAKNTTKIYGPTNLRTARVYDVQITHLVDEGTIVEEGDMVGQLDPSGVQERIKDEELDLENRILSYESAKIDTAIELQAARNSLDNLRSEMEERKLELEKSQFEPPVTIKQAEVALSKAKRNYAQSVEDYQLKLKRARANVRSTEIRMEKQKSDIQMLQSLKNELTIYAPKSGMVIYSRERRGAGKRKVGSTISAWDPVVAELPDMRYMVSSTFVNEVDIRKIKVGQKVEISFDAFPDKQYDGEVIRVANVGEDLNNSDAKVFRVDIEMKGSDPDLRPGMSTANTIVTEQYDDVLYIPIESVYTDGDSVNYVYKQEKFNIQKNEVKVGISNDQYIVITKGLEKGDKILFLPPDNAEELDLISLVQ